MQEKANKDLYDLVSALAGVPDFTTSEIAQLLALANRRMYEAYNRTSYWTRYLISAEPRTITNQICPYTQDGFYVFGAGTTAVDGLYKLNGTESSVAAYTLYDTDGTTELYSLIYSGAATTWNIIAGAPDAGGSALYSNTDSSNSSSGTTSATISETGWTVGTGTANAPVVRDLSDIGEFIRFHRSKPFFNNSSVEYQFSTQSDGAHVFNLISSTDTIVWCTYKKQLTLLTDLDTEGTNSRTEVPLEFFYFVAHGTYADFLRLDGQTEKALMEERVAEGYMAEELDNPSHTANNNTIGQRIRTHVSQQSR